MNGLLLTVVAVGRARRRQLSRNIALRLDTLAQMCRVAAYICLDSCVPDIEDDLLQPIICFHNHEYD